MLLRRDERLHRGNAGWSVSEPNRTLHSTGREETELPLQVSEVGTGLRHECA